MIPGASAGGGKYVDQPTDISASAGNGQATVSFTLPAYDGKGASTYVVTASPGGATASGSTSPITVTGLSNGTSYTFTVTTISGYGVSRASGNSNAVTPSAPAPSFPPASCPPSGYPVGDPPSANCLRSAGPEKCDGEPGYTCSGTYSYQYWCAGCPGYEGGYYGAQRNGCCGYVTPTPDFPTPDFPTPSFPTPSFPTPDFPGCVCNGPGGCCPAGQSCIDVLGKGQYGCW